MRTVILTHADADGICCGAMLLTKFPKSEIFFTKPVSLLADLKNTNADQILISDIAFNRRDSRELLQLFAEKKSRGQDILYFDQHPLPPEVKASDIKKLCKVFAHDITASSSEVVYRYYQKEIPRERVWIAIYGAISDYAEDTPFVQERIRNWDIRALYFEVSTLVLGIKVEKFNSYNAKRRIVHTLANGENPSDVPGLVGAAKQAVTAEFKLYEMLKKRSESSGQIGYAMKLPFFGFRGPAALFAATITNRPVGMYVHYAPKKHIDITIRSRTDKYELNRLAEEAAAFVNGSGGGLPDAAGCRIPIGSFNRFLQKFNELMAAQ